MKIEAVIVGSWFLAACGSDAADGVSSPSGQNVVVFVERAPRAVSVERSGGSLLGGVEWREYREVLDGHVVQIAEVRPDRSSGWKRVKYGTAFQAALECSRAVFKKDEGVAPTADNESPETAPAPEDAAGADGTVEDAEAVTGSRDA